MTMAVFVIPDLHGRHDALIALLKAAELIDENNERINWPTNHMIVQVGDMINGTMKDWANDEKTMELADGLVDYWIMGNHDICYHHNITFKGFSPNPAVQTGVNRWMNRGLMVPAIVIGDTLITHAGVHEDYNFDTAQNAFEAIDDAWVNYSDYESSLDSFKLRSVYGKVVHLSKADLFGAISYARGGKSPRGGILWSDWNEPKNSNFNQVFGHTPMMDGPVMTTYRGSGRFILNIDVGTKSGRDPVGVWINLDGSLGSFVTAKIPTEMREYSG